MKKLLIKTLILGLTTSLALNFLSLNAYANSKDEDKNVIESYSGLVGDEVKDQYESLLGEIGTITEVIDYK